MDINESPVYVLLNPAINHAQKDLPITIFESGGSSKLIRPVQALYVYDYRDWDSAYCLMSLCLSYSSYENAFVQLVLLIGTREISFKKIYFVVKSSIVPIETAQI